MAEGKLFARTELDALWISAVAEPDVQVVWEKKATPEEEEKAKSLQLPPTFFCGLGAADSDTDQDKPGDFDSEIRQAQRELVKQF